MGTSTISVDNAIVGEVSLEARRQGKSLSTFATESLSAMAKISAEGGSPAEMYRLWRSIALMKHLNAIALPSDFVDTMIANQYATDKEVLLSMFRDLGARMVVVLKFAAGDLVQLSRLADDFVGLLPLNQFKITPLQGGEALEIQVIGAGRRIESTEASFEFLRSIIEGYGWTITKHEISVGTIKMWASQRAKVKRPRHRTKRAGSARN